MTVITAAHGVSTFMVPATQLGFVTLLAAFVTSVPPCARPARATRPNVLRAIVSD